VGPALALAGHTAFAFDLFGHGESDRPFDAGFGIADQAEYLDRAFTALRLTSALVVGVDIGGTVALRLAATRPERVRGLVLVNTPAFDAVPGNDIRELQRNTARFAFRAGRGILGAAPLLTSVLEGSVASLAHMPDRLVARYLAPFVGADGVSHLLALASAIDEDDVEPLELESVGVPTLVVWGDADQWVDADVGRRLAATLPNARRVELAGIARLVPEESPDQLAGLILAMVRDADAMVHRETPPAVPAVIPGLDPATRAGDGTIRALETDAPSAEPRDAGVV
jgi:pimeloyl-ACP methyl ester carboxylesterase